MQTQYPHFNYLTEPVFQGIDRLKRNKRYFFPTVEIKDYYDMIDGRNLFDQHFRKT